MFQFGHIYALGYTQQKKWVRSPVYASATVKESWGEEHELAGKLVGVHSWSSSKPAAG